MTYYKSNITKESIITDTLCFLSGLDATTEDKIDYLNSVFIDNENYYPKTFDQFVEFFLSEEAFPLNQED
jgi:hypothetical protein